MTAFAWQRGLGATFPVDVDELTWTLVGTNELHDVEVSGNYIPVLGEHYQNA